MSAVVRFVKERDSLTLAAAVVIGSALQAVIGSLVDDVVAPPINAYAGGVMAGELVVRAPGAALVNRLTGQKAPAAPAIVIKYGKFLSALLKLAIVLYVAVTVARYGSRALHYFA